MSQIQPEQGPDIYEQGYPPLSLVAANGTAKPFIQNSGPNGDAADTPRWPTDDEIIAKLIVARLGDEIPVHPAGPHYIRYDGLVDRGGREANPDQRLRVVWKAVDTLTPDALDNPHGMLATKALAHALKYLNGKTTIEGRSYARNELLPPARFLTVLEVILRAYQDPVVRVLDTINEKMVQTEELSLAHFKYLKGDALMAAKQPFIRQVYEDYFAQLRAWAKTVPKS